jgi:polyisoprenoid-binding protein YceI
MYQSIYYLATRTPQYQLTIPPLTVKLCAMKSVVLGFFALVLFPSINLAQAPTYAIDQAASTIKFSVSASVSIAGTFDKWDAAVTFSSPQLATAVLDIKIQADSVNTGSGLKDGKLKGKDFFDAKNDPLITFHSTKVFLLAPNTIEFDGDFTIRGVTKQEKLIFLVDIQGEGTGSINGTMSFDRKQFGMDSGIPFIRIADRVEVTVDLKGKRVSGPPVIFK